MIFQRLTWEEKIATLKRRRTEEFNPSPEAQNDVPFFNTADMEQILLEVSNASLRELRIDELQSVGQLTVVALTAAATSVDTPENFIGLISAKIGDRDASEVVPSRFFQLRDSISLVYCIFAGKIWFTGANAEFIVMVEPDYDNWSLVQDMLPMSWDEQTIKESFDILWAIDNLR